MNGSLARACAALACAAALASCRRAEPPAPEPQPPITSGSLQVAGLRAPVTIARDTWGIPHITASNEDDLFFAQGFVQAQDRLFQMDLWKRAAQGRLSEVLGANFIDRDAMTRRVQFRGDIEREWASYGPGTQRIAAAFISGINAWVRRARAELPEEFVLAGWMPEYWKPEDLLNRTDAFLASGNADDDLFRARLVAAIGASRVHELFPSTRIESLRADAGVDLSAITYVVPDTIRRIGTAPFFLTLAAPATSAPRPSQRQAHEPDLAQASGTPAARLPLPRPAGVAWVAGDQGGAPRVAVQQVSAFEIPGRRYLIHLSAPGINVAGATSPWLPGVVIGHNDRIAWGMVPGRADTQDVFVERLNPADPRQVERDGRWVDVIVDHERVDVKGRPRPFEYDRQYTPNGVVIAIDRERRLVYTLRWSGAEPGGAGELAAVAINRAGNWAEFNAALSRWKMPAAEFVYADVDGNTARHAAGLIPVRPEGVGEIVTAGWDSRRGWRGWTDLSARSDGMLRGAGAATDNGSAARTAAILARLANARSIDDIRALQHDTHASQAARLLPILGGVRTLPAALEAPRALLIGWNGEVRGDSEAARMYVRWEAGMRRLLAERLVPSEFVSGLAERIDLADVVSRPGSPWFDAPAFPARDRLLIQALSAAVDEARDAAGQGGAELFALTFTHPLAVFDAARRRFDIGPLMRSGSWDAVWSTDSRNGPTFAAIFDVANWDRSVTISAPGQSGSPSSPHYDDLAAPWPRGEEVPLPFSADAVTAATKATLTLSPSN